MAGLKSLVKDTAIYGLSSIVGRFLNWCLVPLYTNLFVQSEYGIVTYIYAWVALLLVLLTYGMETGFFRFANKNEGFSSQNVYTTALTSLFFTSLIFAVAVCIFSPSLARFADCPEHPCYIWMMGVTVALDAFSSLPFAYLRFRKKPIRFAVIRLLNIGLNIGLNLFFLILCPWLAKVCPAAMGWYSEEFGIGYIFLSNLISTCVTLLLLTPQLKTGGWVFSGELLKKMLNYSLPLLILGLAGVLNQSVSTLLFPKICGLPAQEAMSQLGIYNANFKIAIIMVMFTQAFRFAFEPFIFARAGESDNREAKLKTYADATKYFLVAGLFIFLGVMFYLPILKYFISPAYFEGLKVVPIVMVAELFFGIFFNLSLWYKLTDRTIWGTYLSVGGLIVTLALNLLLVPRFGYMGCAWASFFCYGTMMAASYIAGQKYFPIPYELVRMSAYTVLAAILYLASEALSTDSNLIDFTVRTVMLGLFCYAVIRQEGLHRLIKR